MAYLRGFNYDLQELNEWVRMDRASVQPPVAPVPHFSYDLKELNERGGRMDGNTPPMEFQFGTNWARFSSFAGGVIGLSLAMEGMFAFFAESAFLGLFLFGEKRLGPKLHLLTAVMMFLGSWLSGYFIIVTNAFMQHPVGHTATRGGALQLADFWGYLLNPWALWEYAHTMSAAVITGSFVVA